MTRQLLPTRRMANTIETDWQGHPITVTVGLYDNGTTGEVFANVASGGAMQSTVADACVIMSIALQHGVSPADLAKSLGRVPAWINGTESDGPASPIGAIAAAVMEAMP